LQLDAVNPGDTFRFRIRANPCVTRAGKRIGLLKLQDQEAWLLHKGEAHGYQIRAVQVAQEQMLRGKQHGGNPIRIFSVLFDGYLAVNDPDQFRTALVSGIGHGKALGLGLLSVVPVR
jgi:CRISPR system Cascade subunit CasE